MFDHNAIKPLEEQVLPVEKKKELSKSKWKTRLEDLEVLAWLEAEGVLLNAEASSTPRC